MTRQCEKLCRSAKEPSASCRAATVTRMTGGGDGPAREVEDDSIDGQHNALFKRCGRVILRSAYRRVNDRFTAQDLTAEVFRIAWEKREDAARVFTLPWLYKTLANLVGNEYRRRARQAVLTERVGATTAVAVVNKATEVGAVLEAMDELLPPERQILTMITLEQMTSEEAAELLGISTGAASQRHKRAGRKLARLATERGIRP